MTKSNIPIFPLNILPLPEEVVPLHIFEPRYRQLLEDIEKNDEAFGILFVSPDNGDRVGTVVKLISIIKKYPTGESDIVVKGQGSFIVSKYYRNFKDKLYAGAEVIALEPDPIEIVNDQLANSYSEYRKLINPAYENTEESINDIANALELENADRVKYLKTLDKDKKERFLLERLKYRLFILEQEIKSKNIFSLN